MSCAISAIFIIAMIFTMYNSDNTQSIQNFKRIMTPQQNTVYAKIANERRQIYFVGFGLGLLLSFLFLAWNSMSRTGSRRLGRCSTICIVGAITFTTNYFYYMSKAKRKRKHGCIYTRTCNIHTTLVHFSDSSEHYLLVTYFANKKDNDLRPCRNKTIMFHFTKYVRMNDVLKFQI